MSVCRYYKQRVEVDNVNWKPLVAPISADYFSFRCSTSDITIRTYDEDDTTEDTVLTGIQEGVTVGSGSSGGINISQDTYRLNTIYCRFPIGETVCYLKSVQPTATVIVTWVL